MALAASSTAPLHAIWMLAQVFPIGGFLSLSAPFQSFSNEYAPIRSLKTLILYVPMLIILAIGAWLVCFVKERRASASCWLACRTFAREVPNGVRGNAQSNFPQPDFLPAW